MLGLYERELFRIFQPALENSRIVASSKLPFGNPNITIGDSVDTPHLEIQAHPRRKPILVNFCGIFYIFTFYTISIRICKLIVRK